MAQDYSAQHAAIVARYDELGRAYYDAALKFSMLIVTNLFLINAGGLLALANGVFGKAVYGGGSILVPSCGFVVGLLLALLCAYVTYLNFGTHGAQQRERQTIEIWQVAKGRISEEASERGIAQDVPGFMSDGRSFAEFLRDTEKTIAESESTTKRHDGFIQATFWAGQIAGILSAASFVAACILLVMTITSIVPTATPTA